MSKRTEIAWIIRKLTGPIAKLGLGTVEQLSIPLMRAGWSNCFPPRIVTRPASSSAVLRPGICPRALNLVLLTGNAWNGINVCNATWRAVGEDTTEIAACRYDRSALKVASLNQLLVL